MEESKLVHFGKPTPNVKLQNSWENAIKFDLQMKSLISKETLEKVLFKMRKSHIIHPSCQTPPGANDNTPLSC